MDSQSMADKIAQATKKIKDSRIEKSSPFLAMSAPMSKKSGIFTKKYKGISRYRAMTERVDHWIKKHGKKRTIEIMLEQGIITKSKLEKTKRHLGMI